MTNETWDILYQFLATRRAIAYERLQVNPRHQALCHKLTESKKKVEELFERFSVEERLFVYDHYDGETAKSSYLTDEAYMQGLRDSFQIYSLLGVFRNEDGL